MMEHGVAVRKENHNKNPDVMRPLRRENNARYSHNVFQKAKPIKTLTEREEHEKRVDAIRQLLIDAELVVYLGFSFGRINLDLLTTHGGAVDKEVLGTAYLVS